MVSLINLSRYFSSRLNLRINIFSFRINILRLFPNFEIKLFNPYKFRKFREKIRGTRVQNFAYIKKCKIIVIYKSESLIHMSFRFYI